ncbi:hypothetical protein B0T10DRAFT_458077 [Thelonectria olida]|uniref:Uncharacterized protein n=1 Tax=Thelonectria olida TaxID=1576542 RepID=A0A9P9AS67_9HYPO|nr:hypothetical protein B0T10DRAFT_458077 [Thelonectria olida]
MAAPLVDIPASQITATYHLFGRFLVLTAKGEEHAFYLAPTFQREVFFGGLLFSLRAQPGGPGPVHLKNQPPVEPIPFDISNKFNILLPEPHFNNSTVSVETAKGTLSIPIEYEGFVSPPGDKSTTVDADKGNDINAGQRFSDVVTPINEHLLDGSQLKISAQIPQTVAPAKAWVKVHYNPTYFKLVDSAHEAGSITWTFEWAKLPTEPGENPQIIDVTTTNWNGLFGVSSITSKIIQGYIVSFVVLSK